LVTAGGFNSFDAELVFKDGERARVASGLRWNVRVRDGRAAGWASVEFPPWGSAASDRPERALELAAVKTFGVALADAPLKPAPREVLDASVEGAGLLDTLWTDFKRLPDSRDELSVALRPLLGEHADAVLDLDGPAQPPEARWAPTIPDSLARIDAAVVDFLVPTLDNRLGDALAEVRWSVRHARVVTTPRWTVVLFGPALGYQWDWTYVGARALVTFGDTGEAFLDGVRGDDWLGRLVSTLLRHYRWCVHVLERELATWEDAVLSRHLGAAALDAQELSRDLAALSSFASWLADSLRGLDSRMHREDLDLNRRTRTAASAQAAELLGDLRALRESIREGYGQILALTSQEAARDTAALLRKARDARTAAVLVGALTAVIASVGLFAALAAVNDEQGPFRPEMRAAAGALSTVIVAALLGGTVAIVSRVSFRAGATERRQRGLLAIIRSAWHRLSTIEKGLFLARGLSLLVALALCIATLSRTQPSATLMVPALGLLLVALLAHVAKGQYDEDAPPR
jgi:hypothetical protein